MFWTGGVVGYEVSDILAVVNIVTLSTKCYDGATIENVCVVCVA